MHTAEPERPLPVLRRDTLCAGTLSGSGQQAFAEAETKACIISDHDGAYGCVVPDILLGVLYKDNHDDTEL